MSTKPKGMSSAERSIRIELVRARAALERKRLLRSVERLAESSSPADLVRGMLPAGLGALTSRKPADWLLQAASLARRYPIILSSLSSLIPVLGRRRRLWKIGAGLLLSWQIARKVGGDRR